MGLRNILELEWRTHVDPDLTTITVWNHKTVHVTGEPLVVPIAEQPQIILRDARVRHPPATRVITYRGEPVQSVRGAIRAAARDVGIPYGRFTPGGVTFHTLRHTASTILSRLKVNPWLQRDLLGHQDLATTDGYTHLQLEEQRAPLEQLSGELPIAAIVTRPERRATRRRAEANAGAAASGTHENPGRSPGIIRPHRQAPGRPFQRKVR